MPLHFLFMNLLSLPARIYVWIIGLMGSAVVLSNLLRWESSDLIRFACFFLVALFAAGLRVGVKSGHGAALPINILFVLIGIMELSLPETIVIAGATSAIQCLQVLTGPSRNFLTFFNISSIATATWITHFVYFHPLLQLNFAGAPARLIAAATVFYLFNTFPVAAVISLTEHKSLRQLWREPR